MAQTDVKVVFDAVTQGATKNIGGLNKIMSVGLKGAAIAGAAAVAAAMIGVAKDVEAARVEIAKQTGLVGDDLTEMTAVAVHASKGLVDSVEDTAAVVGDLATRTSLTNDELGDMSNTILKTARITETSADSLQNLTVQMLQSGLSADEAEQGLRDASFAAQEFGINLDETASTMAGRYGAALKKGNISTNDVMLAQSMAAEQGLDFTAVMRDNGTELINMAENGDLTADSFLKLTEQTTGSALTQEAFNVAVGKTNEDLDEQYGNTLTLGEQLGIFKDRVLIPLVEFLGKFMAPVMGIVNELFTALAPLVEALLPIFSMLSTLLGPLLKVMLIPINKSVERMVKVLNLLKGPLAFIVEIFVGLANILETVLVWLSKVSDSLSKLKPSNWFGGGSGGDSLFGGLGNLANSFDADISKSLLLNGGSNSNTINLNLDSTVAIDGNQMGEVMTKYIKVATGDKS